MAPQLGRTEVWLQHLSLRSTDIAFRASNKKASTQSSIIDELSKRDNLLARQIRRKLQSSPLIQLTLWERIYIERKLRGSFKRYSLSTEGQGTMSANDIAELEGTLHLGFFYKPLLILLESL